MAWIPKPKFDPGAVYEARRPFQLSGQKIAPGDEIKSGETLSARVLQNLFNADYIVPRKGSSSPSIPTPNPPASTAAALSAQQALKSAINKRR